MANNIQRDLGTLKADVEKLGTHAVDLVNRVTEAGKETVNNAACASRAAVKKATKTMEDNPVATIAGAVGFGVVLGSIVKRIFCRKK